MRIEKQDLYHGAALMQVIEHSQAIIMKMKHKSSEYQISVATAPRGEENRYIYIKHVARNGKSFSFSFSKSERDFLDIELTRNAPVFVVLVCGTSYVCALSKKQFRDLAAERGRLTLVIEAPPGGSMRVKRFGSDKKPLLVAHNSFPKKVVS